jgi:hypothetical protein
MNAPLKYVPVGLAVWLGAAQVQAQVLAPPREEPKFPAMPDQKAMEDFAKQQREMREGLLKLKPGPLEVRPLEQPASGRAARPLAPPQRAPEPQSSPGSRSAVVRDPARVAPPVAQTSPPARKTAAAPAPAPAPAKPPCVYKPVMSDDEINACR